MLFKQVHQGEKSKFYQSRFITTGVIIQNVLGGKTLNSFNIQCALHQINVDAIFGYNKVAVIRPVTHTSYTHCRS